MSHDTLQSGDIFAAYIRASDENPYRYTPRGLDLGGIYLGTFICTAATNRAVESGDRIFYFRWHEWHLLSRKETHNA